MHSAQWCCSGSLGPWCPLLSYPNAVPGLLCTGVAPSAAHPARVLKCPQTICPQQAPRRVRHRGAAPVQAPMRVGHSSALVKSQTRGRRPTPRDNFRIPRIYRWTKNQLIINGVITPISRIITPVTLLFSAIYRGPITPFVTSRAPPCTNLSWHRLSNLLVIYQLYSLSIYETCSTTLLRHLSNKKPRSYFRSVQARSIWDVSDLPISTRGKTVASMKVYRDPHAKILITLVLPISIHETGMFTYTWMVWFWPLKIYPKIFHLEVQDT